MKHLKYFESKNRIWSSWSSIDSDYDYDDYVYIDAWETNGVNDNGDVIAKINKDTEEIIYLDNRAKKDSYAQEEIKKVINSYFTPERRIEISSKKFNL